MSVGFGTNLLTNPSLVSTAAPGTGIGGTSVMPYNYNQNQGLVPQQGSPVLGAPGFVSPQIVAAQNVQPVIAPSSAQEAQLMQFGFDIAACRMVQRAYPSLTAQVLLALVQVGVPARTVLNNPGSFAFPTGLRIFRGAVSGRRGLRRWFLRCARLSLLGVRYRRRFRLFRRWVRRLCCRRFRRIGSV